MQPFSIQGDRSAREALLLLVVVLLASFALWQTHVTYAVDLWVLLGTSSFLLLIAVLAMLPTQYSVDPFQRCVVRKDMGFRRLVLLPKDLVSVDLEPGQGDLMQLILRRHRDAPLVLRSSRDLLRLRRDGQLVAEAVGIPLLEWDPEMNKMSNAIPHFWMAHGVLRKPTEVRGHKALGDLRRLGNTWEFTVPSEAGPDLHRFRVELDALYYTPPGGQEQRYRIDDIAQVGILPEPGGAGCLALGMRTGIVRMPGLETRPTPKGDGQGTHEVAARVLVASVREVQGQLKSMV